MSTTAKSARGVLRAAGVVLTRQGKRGIEVCLVHRPKHKDWTLPKGKLEPQESALLAAVRETREETGCDVVLGSPLPSQSYLADGQRKTVRYWIGHTDGSGPGFTPNHEIDQVVWISSAKAQSKLTYRRDRALLQTAIETPRTSPLIVLRHSQAVRRADWDGKEPKRPLTSEGERDAKELVASLSAFGPVRIITSPFTRCMQTIAPLAEALGIEPETEKLFSETGFERDPAAALERITDVLADPTPTIVCSHRPVLPGLLKRVAVRSGRRPSDVELNPSMPPGSFIVIHRRLHARKAVEGYKVGFASAIERHHA